MGLDSVELLWAVEKHFTIAITDQEAGQIRTVRDFADCVTRHVTFTTNQPCASQHLFYQLRHYFEQRLPLALPVLPTTSLAALLPATNRQQCWEDLQQEIGLRAPVLQARDKNEALGAAISFGGLRLHTRKPPLTQQTVRELVDWLLALNYQQLLPPNKIASEYEVGRTVVGIICETQGLPVEEIALSDQLVYDLGIE